MLEAMPSRERIYAAALLFTVIATSVGCHRAAPDQNKPAGDAFGKLDGDVFIVTQGAENVKLGLVEVRVLPYEETKNSIMKTRVQVEQEISGLQAQLEAAREALTSAEARLKAADAERIAAYEEKALNFAPGETSSEWFKAQQAENAAEDHYRAAGKVVGSAKSTLADLQKQARIWNSGDQYFKSLPSPVASVKTDADGKFSIPLDRKSTFALAAYATRRLFDKTENYYWLISVSLDGQLSKRIFLSNDNLATSESKDSLVHVVE